jgi:FkbM family methyltransferase
VVLVDRPGLTAAAVRLLARRTPYVESELLGLSRLIDPGAVCVDVGAAAGLYTVALSALVGDTGQVHSVEPLGFVHPVWRRVLRSRSHRNVTHHAIALGAEPGEGTMSVPLGRYGPVTGRSFLEWRTSGLGSNSEFAGHREVAVEVDTLDHLCEQVGMTRLDFVKIDVEGAELPVLAGGEQVIERFRPSLLVEIEARHVSRYEHSVADLVDWLAKRDYTMHVWEGGWEPTEHVCAHARNYLFRPGDTAAN